MAVKTCILALLLTSSVCLAQQRRQWLLIYPELAQAGEPVSITPDLWGEGIQAWSSYPDRFGPLRHYKQQIRSACGAGVWVFYAQSIVWPADLVSEIVKLKDGDCVDLNDPVRGRVKFIQHVGVEMDYEFPSLNLFKYRDYVALEGDLRTVTGRKSNVDHPHISLVILGRASWSISGEFGSICLVPTEDSYLQVQGIPDIRVPPYNLEQDSIMEIYKGCSGFEDRKFFVTSEVTTPTHNNVAGDITWPAPVPEKFIVGL